MHSRTRPIIPAMAAWLVVAISLAVTSAAGADDATEPVPVKHRVTGLFSPDRQDDLRAAVERLPNVKLVSIDYKTAEATFAYDPAKFLNNPKPEQVVERFDNLLKSVSFATFGIMPLCTTPRDKLQLVEIKVVGLDCKGCCLAAYESIYKIEGVEQATASFKDGLVTAWINPEKTDRAALETALKQRGVVLAAP